LETNLNGVFYFEYRAVNSGKTFEMTIKKCLDKIPMSRSFISFDTVYRMGVTNHSCSWKEGVI
jgi:hypothetical protein